MRKRDKVRGKVVRAFSKVLDFEAPMLVGGMATALLVVSCESKAAVDPNINDMLLVTTDSQTCLVYNA